MPGNGNGGNIPNKTVHKRVEDIENKLTIIEEKIDIIKNILENPT